MNGPVPAVRRLALTALPLEFEALMPPPLLLPGENLEHYHLLRQALFGELAPKSAIEWLLAIDIADLSWEIRRYNLLRHKLLQDHRHQAIEAALRRIDLPGIAPDRIEDATFYTRQNALSWRSDSSAAAEIEARLASYGYDQHALNWEVFAQARDIFLMFEGLLIAAQKRRTFLLKEIDSRQNARLHVSTRGCAQRTTSCSEVTSAGTND
jgi:hypothetical protein